MTGSPALPTTSSDSPPAHGSGPKLPEFGPKLAEDQELYRYAWPPPPPWPRWSGPRRTEARRRGPGGMASPGPRLAEGRAGRLVEGPRFRRPKGPRPRRPGPPHLAGKDLAGVRDPDHAIQACRSEARMATTACRSSSSRKGYRPIRPARRIAACQLCVLDQRGGKMTSAALSRTPNFPALQLRGLVAVVQPPAEYRRLQRGDPRRSVGYRRAQPRAAELASSGVAPSMSTSSRARPDHHLPVAAWSWRASQSVVHLHLTGRSGILWLDGESTTPSTG